MRASILTPTHKSGRRWGGEGRPTSLDARAPIREHIGGIASSWRPPDKPGVADEGLHTYAYTQLCSSMARKEPTNLPDAHKRSTRRRAYSSTITAHDITALWPTFAQKYGVLWTEWFWAQKGTTRNTPRSCVFPRRTSKTRSVRFAAPLQVPVAEQAD